MKEMKYFKHCKSLDEVKSEYKNQVQEWLTTSKRSGEPKTMEIVDEQYQEISQRTKFKQLDTEVQEDFIAFPKVVKELVELGLDMEMCGSWLWVSGDTISHKEELKEMGLRYSPNKKMWYYRPKWSRSTNSSPMSLDYIRRKYGSDKVEIEQEFVFDKPPYKEPAKQAEQGRVQA